jgi:hypothetical protein
VNGYLAAVVVALSVPSTWNVQLLLLVAPCWKKRAPLTNVSPAEITTLPLLAQASIACWMCVVSSVFCVANV